MKLITLLVLRPETPYKISTQYLKIHIFELKPKKVHSIPAQKFYVETFCICLKAQSRQSPLLTFPYKKAGGPMCLVLLIPTDPTEQILKAPARFLSTQNNQPCTHFYPGERLNVSKPFKIITDGRDLPSLFFQVPFRSQERYLKSRLYLKSTPPK